MPERCYFPVSEMYFSYLKEVALQQALESLAMAGLPRGAGPVGTPVTLSAQAE